ncbi:MAG: acyl carrier protein [Saprospiraceae bacterium]|nr:acyl carrier protein [Saprospiraceae bacterium]
MNQQQMDELKQTLKEQIIQELNLKEVKPEDIADDTPLFGDGLGLDSIDALELIVIMENFHGVKITDASVGKEVLYSINTMAEYITQNKPA